MFLLPVIKCRVTKITVEKNEDGKVAAYAYAEVEGKPLKRFMIFPNAEIAQHEATPYEVSKAAENLRVLFGCE